VLAVLASAALLLGGTNLIEAIRPPLQFTLRWLAAALAITAFVDVLVIAVLWILRRVIERLSGRQIEYKR
jgi:hypothetical protein